MHQYLKAIGFDNIKTRKDLKNLLSDVRENYTHQVIVSYLPGEDFCELSRKYGDEIGVALCGELDENDQFEQSYYFPYFLGSGISTYAEVAVERKIEDEQYVGMCEDPRIGISLIFTVQNGIEYMRELQAGLESEHAKTINLAGLALSGTVLLPVVKDERQIENEQKASDNRKMLLRAARNGDQSAIETLTLDDIDTYSQVSKRLVNEDILSIVDTYFMPYGMECDLYSVMGVICAVRKRKNEMTGVELYQMILDVNELKFDVCVPVNEVLGEPDIGRRFKTTVWLQGYIGFSDPEVY